MAVPPADSSSFGLLPNDALNLIANRISILDRLALVRVNRRWNTLLSNDALWKPLFRQQNSWSLKLYEESRKSWRRAYVVWLRTAVAQWRNPASSNIFNKKLTLQPLPSARVATAVAKLAFIGPEREGKSVLVQRLTKQTVADPLSPYVPTIGAGFSTRTSDDGTCKLEIWDTAGAPRYRALTPMYVRGCHSVCLVYDGSKPLTRERFLDYGKDLKDVWSGPLHIFIIATKIDLGTAELDKESIDQEILKMITIPHHVYWFSVSALTGAGVDDFLSTIFDVVANGAPQPLVIPTEEELKAHLKLLALSKETCALQ